MIEQLSQETIQQIAAGEVIERPVSAVKELVENSIDAGADEISVEVVHGGKEKIAVYDNGEGIPAGEMEKAFLPHATSKIQTFDDLAMVQSLGFRGEALTSIISVAKVKARSRTKEEDLGQELTYEDGDLVDKRPVAMPVGTQMEVEEIFGKIPVRKRFLKSDQAEWKQVSSLLYPLAISHPDISFRAVKDSKLVFQTRKENTLNENLLVLFGHAYYDSITAVQGEGDYYKLSGRISNNRFYRGNRKMQYIFINGRYVENTEIGQLVEDEYKSLIPNGRFPAFQLFIDVDPSLVNVNIHPNKKEVSLTHKEDLADLISKTIHQALYQGLEIPGPVEKEDKPVFDLSDDEGYRRILEEYAWGDEKGLDQDQGRPGQNPFQVKDQDGRGDQAPGQAGEDQDLQEDFSLEDFSLEDLDDDVTKDQAAGEGTGSLAQEGEKEEGQDEVEEEAGPDQARLDLHGENKLAFLLNNRYAGRLFNTFLLFEDHEKEVVYMVDQHAAHERVNYERFMKQVKNGKVISQRLLTPLLVDLDPDQMEALKTRLPFFKTMGYDVDAIGEKQAAIREVPTIFKGQDDELTFISLLDAGVDDLTSFDTVVDQMAMKACKASVKQGDQLSEPEVVDLIRQLGRTDYPYTCPHGRPTLVKVNKSWFEKLFMRIK